MANNAATKVIVATPISGTGSVFRAPIGTALPTTEAAAKNAAFVNVGYISSDGVSRTIGQDTSEIVAAGGDIVRIVKSKHKVTYKFKMLETNAESLRTYHGTGQVTITVGTPTTSTKTTALVKSGFTQRDEWILDTVDGTFIRREVIPIAEVSALGDVKVLTDGSGAGALEYEVELTAYPDSAGVKAYVYTDDGVFIP